MLQLLMARMKLCMLLLLHTQLLCDQSNYPQSSPCRHKTPNTYSMPDKSLEYILRLSAAHVASCP